MITFPQSWQSRRGETIFGQEWRPNHTPRAVLVLVHGLGEHSSRYQHVGDFFIRAGYALIGMDLPGHGKTSGIKGYTTFAEICTEVEHVVSLARQRYPNLPVFLYGHSMGGAVTLFSVLRSLVNVEGAIVTSPGIQPGQPVAKWKLPVAKLMARLYPAFTMANGLDVNNLSHNPNVIQAYTSDPLVHDRVSAIFGLDLVTEGNWIQAHASEWRIPLLLMVGSKDHIVSQAAVEAFAKAVPAQYLTFKCWEGLYHEMHNEPESGQVLQTMVDWLEQHGG